MKIASFLSVLALVPNFAFAAPIPNDLEVPKEIRKALARVTILKYVITESSNSREVDRQKVCDLQSDISVYDLHGNTTGFRMPMFESFGECPSTVDGKAVTLKVGAQMYDGWKSVPQKSPGKFFFARLGASGANAKETYAWVEAGSADPKTTSIVGSVNLDENAKESFAAYIEVVDPKP